jgi:hypothetical protein
VEPKTVVTGLLPSVKAKFNDGYAGGYKAAT